MDDRLGWTGAAQDSLQRWPGWTRFAAEVRADASMGTTFGRWERAQERLATMS